MADANALARFDLGAQPRDRPVAPVGHRFLQQGRDHAQGRFALHRGRAGRHAGLQRRDAAVHEIAAPETDRVFTHAERLGNPWAGPAGQRQQHGAGAVRLAAIARTGHNRQVCSLFFGCGEWRFSRHACTCESAPTANQPTIRWSTKGFLLRLLNRLTDRTINSTKIKPGRHADGGGLYLVVDRPGGKEAAKRWVFLYRKDGRLREMGLGGLLNVPVGKARAEAENWRQVLGSRANRGDPITERKRLSGGVPTFGDFADKFLEAKGPGWRNDKHRAQWRMTLTEYAAALR